MRRGLFEGGKAMASILDPRRLERYEDLSLALLRVATGAFLIYGTQDNVLSAARMEEFVGFLRAHHFVMPELMAPLSVYAQFVGGILLVLGLLTRWTGLVIAFNFVVAVWMVHWPEDYRGWWPAAVLVFLGLHFACRGGGRWSADALLFRAR
ncbi:MAG TPA: DoxX family protein [Allosphingosinicella sp.]